MEDSTFNLDNKKAEIPVVPWKEGNPELFDALNPYDPTTPAGKLCFNLYAKTSPENKKKLKANIKINARGNVETMGREFFVLTAAPNGVDILERDWVIFFLGDAAQREAEKIWCTLFDTPRQANKFINQFVGRDNELCFKIMNIMWIFGFIWTSAKNQQGWHYKKSDEERVPSFIVHFAALTKPYEHKDEEDENTNELNTFWIRYAKIDGEICASTDIFDAKDGYAYIVSKPIQK